MRQAVGLTPDVGHRSCVQDMPQAPVAIKAPATNVVVTVTATPPPPPAVHC